MWSFNLRLCQGNAICHGANLSFVLIKPSVQRFESSSFLNSTQTYTWFNDENVNTWNGSPSSFCSTGIICLLSGVSFFFVALFATTAIQLNRERKMFYYFFHCTLRKYGTIFALCVCSIYFFFLLCFFTCE